MGAGGRMVGAALGAPPGAAADPVSPAARCEDLSRGLQIAPWLQPIVVDVCLRSPTFRRQVARLADVDGLTVTVHRLIMPAPSTALWRAQTLITRVGGLVRSADVQVPSCDARMIVFTKLNTSPGHAMSAYSAGCQPACFARQYTQASCLRSDNYQLTFPSCDVSIWVISTPSL